MDQSAAGVWSRPSPPRSSQSCLPQPDSHNSADQVLCLRCPIQLPRCIPNDDLRSHQLLQSICIRRSPPRCEDLITRRGWQISGTTICHHNDAIARLNGWSKQIGLRCGCEDRASAQLARRIEHPNSVWILVRRSSNGSGRS